MSTAEPRASSSSQPPQLPTPLIDPATGIYLRVCPRCLIPRPLGLFGNDSRRKDGKTAWCGVCLRAVRKVYDRRRRVGGTPGERFNRPSFPAR